MKDVRTIKHVTNDTHSVSLTTGTGIEGAILNVARHVRFGDRYVIQHASHNGLLFASSDEAWQFALERGYIVEYFTSPELRARRVARGRVTHDDPTTWTRSQVRAANRAYAEELREVNA